MTRSLAVLALLAGLPATLPAQTGITIYQDGRVLLRRTLPVAVPNGASTHRLALGPLDPGSLFALDPAVQIVGTTYDAAVDEANTMRRAIGRRLVFETGGMTNGVRDTVVAEVLGVDPERFRLANGSVLFHRPGLPRYPADIVQIAPTTTVALASSGARPSLALAWFSEGAAWSASYSVLLGRGTARIGGQATIQSGSLGADDAEVQLLAGNVGRAASPRPMMRAEMMAVAQELRDKSATEESIGEAHLYTLPGRVQLRPGVATSVALFEPASAAWERVFTVRGVMPWYGPVPQLGDETEQPVEVQYVLQRPRGTPFGDRPLPTGVWRIYEADQAGRQQLVGEAGGGHIAAGQPVRLSAGTAFDLTARRTETEFVTRRESNRTIATIAYAVTVANAKDSVAMVDVLEERRGEWSVTASSVPAERLSTTQTRFRLRVPARGEARLTYQMRVIW